MGKKLYVGNLGYNVTDADLSQLFSQHGMIESNPGNVSSATGHLDLACGPDGG